MRCLLLVLLVAGCSEDLIGPADAGGTDDLPTGTPPDLGAAADAAAVDAATADLAAAPDLLAPAPDMAFVGPAGALAFEVARSYPAQGSSAVLADVTGDGKLDVVGLDTWDSEVQVLPGDGAGALGAGVGSPFTLSQPQTLAAGDFDGDGDLDVAFTAYSANRIQWMKNDGAGRFGPPADLMLSSGQSVLAAADVDGDGRVDLLANGGGSARVFLQDAQGALVAPPLDSTCLSSARELVTGDFDGDGKLDVAMAGDQARVGVCLGDGTGRFAAAKVTTSAAAGGFGSTLGVVRADFDADGRADLAALGDKGVERLLGAAGGGLTSKGLTMLDARVTGGVAGDLDGDGQGDLLVTLTDGSSATWLYLLRGDANGGFTRVIDYAHAHAPLRLGDLDGDGHLDLVMGGGFSVEVMLGRAGGTLRGAPAWRTLDFGAAAFVVDLDGDGVPEVVSIASSSSAGAPSEVVVAVQDAGGSFATLRRYGVPGDVDHAEVIDLDGDGKLDLVVARGGMDDVAWLPGGGDTTFAAPQSLGGRGRPFAAGDLDGDGKPEIITVWGSLEMRLGQNGAWSTLVPFDYISSVHLADVDGDGALDLVSTEGDAGFEVLAFRRGRGNLMFDPVTPTGGKVGTYTLGDLDGDGDLDLVGDAAGGVETRLFGAGGFGAPVEMKAQELAFARDLRIADLNRDGKGDLLYSGGYGLYAWLGDGRGGYSGRFAFPPGYADHLGVGDVDGDGWLDVAAFADRAAWVGINISR